MAYLIKGAHVVDPQVGLDDVRDVLIEDKTIVSVEPSIEAADATGAGDCFVAGLTCEVLRILSEEAGEESFGRGTGAGAELPSEDATISLDILESCYRDILLFATACGAICTTKIGAITALRDRSQVIEFLSNL